MGELALELAGMTLKLENQPAGWGAARRSLFGLRSFELSVEGGVTPNRAQRTIVSFRFVETDKIPRTASDVLFGSSEELSS